MVLVFTGERKKSSMDTGQETADLIISSRATVWTHFLLIAGYQATFTTHIHSQFMLQVASTICSNTLSPNWDEIGMLVNTDLIFTDLQVGQ